MGDNLSGCSNGPLDPRDAAVLVSSGAGAVHRKMQGDNAPPVDGQDDP